MKKEEESNITREERAMLNDAVKLRKGEIIEPANDDKVTMSIIVSLFEKELVKIDFDNDKLFVSEFGKLQVRRLV